MWGGSSPSRQGPEPGVGCAGCSPGPRSRRELRHPPRRPTVQGSCGPRRSRLHAPCVSVAPGALWGLRKVVECGVARWRPRSPRAAPPQHHRVRDKERAAGGRSHPWGPVPPWRPEPRAHAGPMRPDLCRPHGLFLCLGPGDPAPVSDGGEGGGRTPAGAGEGAGSQRRRPEGRLEGGGPEPAARAGGKPPPAGTRDAAGEGHEAAGPHTRLAVPSPARPEGA